MKRRLSAVVIAGVLASPLSVLEPQELTAHRVAAAPAIDGRDDDAAWRAAPVASGFTVFRPTEGAEPAFRTEVRAAFDAKKLYVLVRAFDPHPDSIIGLLSRRDNVAPPSDVIRLWIDSYHDGRNGYEYLVNAAGVKTDVLLFDDDRLDLSWDGIWDVATRVDSLGWVAEFAIPFAQLRFRGRPGVASTFGIMVWRAVGRTGEQSSWPRFRPSFPGIVSQFTRLTGLDDLPGGMRLEAAPYALARGRNAPGATGSTTETTVTAGADLKVGPLPNVTIDATINPDFGQVESDPAVLNLSSFETFLAERRPFFLEGAGLFRFTMSRDPNSNESLFYTRRIGRRPQLADTYGDAETPTETTILGAGKLTSRFGGNTSLASLAAVTAEERGARAPGGGRYQVEPRSAYSITRVQRDFRGGRSGAGLILTGVQRALDDVSSAVLPRQALSGGFVTQHQSPDGQWSGRLWLAASNVTGTAQAITRTQLSPIHAFQRPDDHHALDTLRTALSGTAAQIFLGKVGGVRRFGSSLRYLSPGFDPMDVGFLNEADQISWTMDVGLQSRHASRWYRSAGATLLHIRWWSGPGMTQNMVVLRSNAELPSQWTVSVNSTLAQLGGTLCSLRCTRGGLALRKSPAFETNVVIAGDPRRTLAPDFAFSFQRDDEGRTQLWRMTPGILWRAASNLQLGVSTVVEDLTEDAQFYKRFGSATSDTTHYTVARLEQSTRAHTTRVSYAATLTLSVQWYAQPFVARGQFSDVRELNIPRARVYDQRFKPYADTLVTAAPGGTRLQQFRSNLVTRWEYRPGSVLFVVWSQGRDLSNSDAGTLQLSRDARDLFALTPRNTIAVKASYWWGR